jgi:hypothetical protein
MKEAIVAVFVGLVGVAGSIAQAADDELKPKLPPNPSLPTAPTDDDLDIGTPDQPAPGSVIDQPVRREVAKPPSTESETSSPASIDSVKRFIMTWQSPSKNAVYEMMNKYGMPDEMTPTMVVWLSNEPWAKTVVHKMPMPHSFPTPHVDVLEQVVPLKVPLDKIDDVVTFDGSISVNRTKGEVSVTCDKESTNFLALNLAKDIIDGRRSVEQARTFFARTALQVQKGEKPTYVAELRFRPLRSPDTDEVLIKDGKVIDQARK